MAGFRTSDGGWYGRERMADGVTLIWERHIKPDYRCNIWHVRGRDRDLLVDTGFGLEPLRAFVEADSGRPLVALASHSHCDHIGGHHEFDERWVHGDEAAIMRAPTRDNTVAAPYVCDDMFVGAAPPGFDSAAWNVTATEPTRLLAEGDVVDLGDRAFEVLHAPGHSPGSIALFEPATGILFSGDVVHDGPNGFGRMLWYHSDEDAYLESVERLCEVPAQTVHAGHFHSFGADRYRTVLDDYIARRRGPGCPADPALRGS
ncbi:MAG: MBL fold metallo-hydrolase [Rhodospirillaceae bacterium]|jgi:glyoxylase-like metal-dependent hydrolase (beta-lactamase superfamily II)|nr:MBL fold metallo-hydrolase [Rhodospirillaceae bacterium]MBT6119679.1 MBL fold metallo-hydrolase [Rhodospirillaceae bacterium]